MAASQFLKLRRATWLDMHSLLIFLLANAVGILLFRNLFWLFVFLAIVDTLATFLSVDQIVLIDRCFFTLAVIILSSALFSYSAIYLVIEITLILLALDFSFLLRKLSDTSFEIAILRRWLSSFGKYLALSFFVSFAMIYIYSYTSGVSVGAPILAISSVAAIFIILVVTRSSLPFFRRS